MKSKKITSPTYTIEIDEVKYHNIFTNVDNPIEKKITISNRVKQKIFTDGQLIKTEVEKSQSIKEYYINNQKYNNQIDTLTKKKVYIENANYIVKVTIAQEWLTIGKLTGWFDVIKNIEVYFRNKRDTKALKEAKKTIAMFSRQVNIESSHDILFSKKLSNKTLEYEEAETNTYQRKRTINH